MKVFGIPRTTGSTREHLKLEINLRDRQGWPCKTPSQGSTARTSYAPLLSVICDIVLLTGLGLHHVVAQVELHSVLAIAILLGYFTLTISKCAVKRKNGAIEWRS
jgi:hypothetical protein